MPNCAQLQQHVLSWIQICLWGQYLCFSPTRIQRTQSEVVADKRLICSSALSAINASSRFVIHFSVRVTFLPRVLTDGSTFFSIFSCTFCSTFFSSVLRECFFTHFFQYFFEYFSEYSPARVLFLVLFRVLFWVISCESTFWSNFFSFLSLLSVQFLLPLKSPFYFIIWAHLHFRRVSGSINTCSREDAYSLGRHFIWLFYDQWPGEWNVEMI